MAASRSLSFTRSSAAPVTTVSPFATAAAANSTGSSSIEIGTSLSGTTMPCSALGRTSMSARGSPFARGRVRTRMSAPIRRRMSIRAVRVGLTPTSRMTSGPAPAIRPATMKKAADEKSPGTSMWVAFSVAGPSTVISLPVRATGTPKRPQHPLGVIARHGRFTHGRPARRRKSGDQEGRLDLRARDLESMLATDQRAAACNYDRRLASVRANVCPHASKGSGDPLHRPLHQ